MWDPVGGMQNLGFGQAGEVNPSDINESGTVAGIFQSPGSTTQAFLWTSQESVTFTDGSPEHTKSGRGANGINDAGQVTGAICR